MDATSFRTSTIKTTDVKHIGNTRNLLEYARKRKGCGSIENVAENN